SGSRRAMVRVMLVYILFSWMSCAPFALAGQGGRGVGDLLWCCAFFCLQEADHTAAAHVGGATHSLAALAYPDEDCFRNVQAVDECDQVLAKFGGFCVAQRRYQHA